MRGVIFLDYKFCLRIHSKCGTAGLAREWLARTKASWSRFNRRRPDLSIRLKRLSRAASRMVCVNIHIGKDSLSYATSPESLGRNVPLPIPRSTIRTGRHYCRPGRQKLGARARDDVLLVDRRRGEFETVEPGHVLHVVAVGPEGMRNVIGAGGDVSIIAEEASTESVTGVDVLHSHGVGGPAQVADDVIEPRVIDVVAERGAVDPPFGRRRPCRARLPG